MNSRLLERHAAFSIARDPVAVAALIREHLVGSNDGLLKLQPVYSRFKGDHGGMVTYKVTLLVREEARDSREVTSFVTVRTGPRWRLASQRSRFADPVFRKGTLLEPTYLHDKADLLLLSFPLDRALPALRKVVRPRGMRRWLEGLGVLDPSPPARTSVSQSRVHIASYRPERRAVLRFEAVARRGDRPIQSFYLRLHSDRSMPFAASQALQTLHETGAPVPVLLGAPHRNAVLESRCPGRPLESDAIREGSEMREVGRVLARVHDVAPPPRLRRRSLTSLVEASLTCVEDLRSVHPALGARARHLSDSLGILDETDDASLLHGDLHGGQFLSDGNRIFLVDWDRASSGDPAQDLGTLAARLQLDFGTAGRRAIQLMLAGYSEERTPPPSNRIAWHQAQALLRLCNAPFRRVELDWMTQTDRILSFLEGSVLC